MSKSANILLLEPYLGGSHKDFVNGLSEYSNHKIIPLTMSGEHRKWRLLGSAVPLAKESEHVEEEIDVILASSLADLSGFTSLTNPRFSETPVVLYMHENQLYDWEDRDQFRGYFNYLGALTASKILFSSQFHFDEFFEYLPGFLSRLPDYQHAETVGEIRDKSEVLHPGIHLSQFDEVKDNRANRRPVILWNQRWTADKNPELFFKMMNRLDDAGFEFDLILAGDNRHEKPVAFENAWKRYGQRIIHFGYIHDKQKYSELLHKADIVVSTAVHEYFCVAILEAIYCGAHPVVPNRLTYPELIPDSLKKPLLHSPVMYDDEDELFAVMKNLLSEETKPLPKASLQKFVKEYDWPRRIRLFDDLLSEIAK